MADGSIGAYLCAPPEDCPGGTTNYEGVGDGGCAPKREGIACGKCEAGYGETAGECAECRGASQWAGFLVWPGAALFVIGAFYGMNKVVRTKTDVALYGSVAFGMVIATYQTLGIYTTVKVEWPSNSQGAKGFSSVAAFDIDGLTAS